MLFTRKYYRYIVQNKQIYLYLFKEQNYPTVPKLIENYKDKLKRRKRQIENGREEVSRLWQNINTYLKTVNGNDLILFAT